MIRFLTVFVCAALATSATHASDIDDLANQFEARLKASRYMESSDVKDVEIPEWKGFPTRRYTYAIKDKDGTVKKADVVMLNPSAKQIATWIVDALTDVTGKYDPADGKKVFQHILGQSGGQFPIRGVVYEDILPADGKNEIYCFRDGVTVQIEGVPHRGTDPMSAEQVEKSVNGKVTRVFTYARIQSTSPQQFIDNGGDKEVLSSGKPTTVWLDEVRKAYQAAWNSDRNELLVAWVKANYAKNN